MKSDVFLKAAKFLHGGFHEGLDYGCCYAIARHAPFGEINIFKYFFNGLYRADAQAIPGQCDTWWFENVKLPASRKVVYEHRLFALLLADIIYNEKTK